MTLYWMFWGTFGLVIGLVVCLIILMAVEPRRKKRVRLGQCTKCGYDILRAPGDTCPECGHRWADD
ncbi:MAG: hypothetical protein ACYTGG_05195 [Planctomycetota bacterium]|jgi:hypothetical protein